MNYDAVLAAAQWSKGHTRRREGPPSPPAPVDAPPPVAPAPLVERRQSHPSYWLTVVYETSPPGGNVLTPERLGFVAKVEDAIASVARYDAFCYLRPSALSVAASRPNACERWVPSDVGGEACLNTTCSAPMSILSFEALIRNWFSEVRGGNWCRGWGLGEHGKGGAGREPGGTVDYTRVYAMFYFLRYHLFISRAISTSFDNSFKAMRSRVGSWSNVRRRRERSTLRSVG